MKFHIKAYTSKKFKYYQIPWFCKEFNGIQGQLPNMNRFGQWEVGQVSPSKDDIYDPDFAPKKCNFAVNKKVATNS